MSIRRKIYIPMITLMVVSCIIVFVSSIFLFTRELNNAMKDKINVAEMVVEQEIVNLKNNARIAARVISNSSDLIEALILNDRERILEITRNQQIIARINTCTITDNNGIVVSRTHDPNFYGDNISHQPHIKQAMAGNIESYIIRGVSFRLGVYAAAQIFDSNDNMIGIVSLGYRLDSQELANNMKALTGCEIAFFMDDIRVSTTKIDDDSVLGMKAPEEISKRVLSGMSYIGNVRIFGNDLLAKYSPLYSANNEIVGMVFVGFNTLIETNKTLFYILSGILITIAVLITSIFISRFVSRIVERQLENMMREIKDADEIARKAIIEKNMLSNLNNIMNGLDTMIYVTDPKTNEILFMNNTMKKHYGIEGDCVGQLCYKILQNNLDSRCDFCPCIYLDKEPDKPIVWEEHSTKTNFIYRNVDRYINWSNNKVVHIQHSVDMTELLAAKEHAEQSSRYKSEFLANMSHEIRTPMNAILGIAEIQLQNKTPPINSDEAFTRILESGDLLLNIINDILDLSKIEAGKLEITPIKYDIPSLINDTAQLNCLRYEGKPILFALHVDESTPHDFYGDELRIKQVLNNILSNAFKYTDEGNVELHVSVELMPSENQEKDVILILRVSDTGQGMSQKQLEKLFDEYSRFNMEANRTTIGAGLGMSISKRLIDLMNGDIEVVSKEGEGSIFTVRIPQKRIGTDVCGGELAEKLRNFRYRSTSLTKKTQFLREYMPYGNVLVVDDVESNIYVVNGMLAPYKLKLDTASSGFEAIEKVKDGNVYDIIFMDHMMPKMDGIEATKILRSMGYTNSIIALTANALIGRAEMFLQNGFDGFISKPIDSRELNLLLNDFIRNRKPPEVVEAARLEQQKMLNDAADPMLNENKKLDIEKFFVRDSENAINVLEKLYPKFDNLNKEEIELYVITVHGMKSALANIGENKLSKFAAKLEQAGDQKNISIMSSETPKFMEALKLLVIKYKPDEKNKVVELSSENAILLKDKLLEIQSACKEFDKKTIKIILKELEQKAWPAHIEKILNNISVHVLHSEFEEAADEALYTIENLLK